ncbi:hypothetical protein D3C79_627940 [compost metagenome]
MAQCRGFVHFLEQLLPAQGEMLIDGKLRYQVVVVGVEPLGHFLGVGSAAAVGTALGRHATGHGEQGLQGGLGTVMASETLGDDAEGQRVRQYLVVPGEIADGQQLDASILLGLPVRRAQVAANLAQAGFVQLTFPEGFLGFFQFAVAADTRKTQVMCQCHLLSLRMQKIMRGIFRPATQ